MYSVGRVQKIGCIDTNPIAASDRPAIASTGVSLSAPETKIPTAVTSSSVVPINRCLRVRSARRGKNATASRANATEWR